MSLFFRGRFPISTNEMRSAARSGDEARPWRVLHDLSNSFRGASFRLSDLRAGGFDRGTIFQHQTTREKRIVDGNGIAKRIRQKRSRRARSKSTRKSLAIH